MLILVDVDGTVIKNHAPNKELIERLNYHFNMGDIILILTNRPIIARNQTEKMLKRIGLSFHGIICSDMNDNFKNRVIDAIQYENKSLVDNDISIRIYAKAKGFKVYTP